jgi:hypothetical protein
MRYILCFGVLFGASVVDAAVVIHSAGKGSQILSPDLADECNIASLEVDLGLADPTSVISPLSTSVRFCSADENLASHHMKSSSGCSEVTIRCKTEEELRDAGHVAACNQATCEIHASHEWCELMGFKDGDKKNPLDIRKRIKESVKPRNFQEAEIYCGWDHELEHAINPQEKKCKDEENAFGAQEQCAQRFFERHCQEPAPVWGPNECLNLAVRVCGHRGAKELNTCVCDKKKAKENPLKCQDCFDRCVAASDNCNVQKIPQLPEHPQLQHNLKCSNRKHCKNMSDAYCQ